ncbi:MAG TPA: hypothetical protein VHM93_12405 [Candidatus Acidoferrum sp.]|nr:hypothetical protein [Candidatus Acidoferrum sp.]
MIIRMGILVALILGTASESQPPAGRYLYLQPPPTIVEFQNDEILLTPVRIQHDSPSQGIEIKPGIVIPFGSAEVLSRNKKEFNVLPRIRVKKGTLVFDGVKIDFGSLRIYKVRAACRWGEWVVCDGYSSASADVLKIPSEKRERSLPSEVSYFNPKNELVEQNCVFRSIVISDSDRS